MWYVYILKCKNNTLYTGITDSIERRLKEHNSGKGGKYTAARIPVTLLYSQVYRKRPEALRRESQLKKRSRAKKLALVSENHNKLKQLSRREN